MSNTFNLEHDGEDPSGSDAVVVDNMVVELSSVQLLRLKFKTFLFLYSMKQWTVFSGKEIHL